MNDLPKATLRRKPRFSFVWIVPALCLAGFAYFLKTHYEKQGPEITIQFPEAGELVADKTVIKYLGVPVGHVTGLSVNLDSNTVVATAQLDKSMAKLAREGTTFTTVKPQLGFGGIQGLSTIFSGAYLALHPGKGEELARNFKGYSDAHPPLAEEPGLSLVVTSPRAASLNPGDPVLYRGVTVGSITDSSISSDGKEVMVHIKIDYRFDQFVRDNTVFWQASGIRAKLGLFNSQISMDSVESLMRGGIAFATPNAPGAKVKSGHSFALQPAPPKDAETWAPSL